MITASKDGKEPVDQSEVFLGYLATIMESWKIILIIPLLVGALTYVYLAARPAVYRSDAVLRLTKDAVVVLKSGRVFGAAVKKVGSAQSSDAPAPASVVVASASAVPVTGALDSRDNYNVSVTYNSGAGAAAILQEVIDTLPGATMPSTFNRTRLEERVKLLTEAQENITKSLKNMNAIYDRLATGEPTPGSLGFGGDYGESVAQLMATLGKNNEDLGTAKEDLQPTFVADDVIQPPTVPGSAVARSVSPFVTLAVVLSFAVLLVLVVLRDVLKNATTSPNLIRVRRALLPWARS
jgi:hypothetical protein